MRRITFRLCGLRTARHTQSPSYLADNGPTCKVAGRQLRSYNTTTPNVQPWTTINSLARLRCALTDHRPSVNSRTPASLRSTGSAAYVLPRTTTQFGERGFFYSGPAAWNTLPSDRHDITDTSTFRGNDSRMYFLIVLTTDYNCWRSWTSRIAAPYKWRID